MGRSLTLAFVASLVACAGPGFEATRPARLVEQVDLYLSQMVDWGFSGAVLIGRADDVLLEKGYGLADVEGGILATASTRFDAGSIAKQLTAAAILKLVDERRLGLDASIEELIEGVPEEKRAITLRHLLSHTSGLPREVGRDFEQMSREVFVDLVLDAPLRFDPGSGYSYSNAGYALLAAILEGQSGVPFHNFMREELFAPLGLASTGFIGDTFPNLITAHSIGGSLDGQSPEEWVHTWNHRGSGGIVTTVRDLFTWVRALEAGMVLPDSLVKQMEEPGESGYGFGVSVAQSPSGGARLGHVGLWYAFSSVLYRYPDDDDLTVIVLSNRASPEFQYAMLVARALEETILSDRPRRPPPPIVQPDAGALHTLAGVYGLDADEAVTVTVNSDGLRIKGDGPVTQSALTQNGTLDPAELERLAAQSQAILMGFSRADFATLDSVAPAARAERYRAIIPPIWEAREDSLGALAEVEVTGTLAPYGVSDNRQTYAVLQFQRGSEGIRLDWSPAGVLLGLENEDPELPRFLTAFRSIGDNTFAAYHPETGVEVRAEFRERGLGWSLTVLRSGLPPLELRPR